MAVSLHLAGERGSGCIAMRLHLPEEWTRSRKRCKAAGMPSGMRFQKKWQIALNQLDAALAWGVSQHLVLADAGYGDAREFRDGVRESGLHYLMVRLDHFQGRTWRGFHHHAPLCMVAYGFLAMSRALSLPTQ